jgi:hypothetical protein
MTRPADTIQKELRELVRRLMRFPSRRSAKLLPDYWTPEAPPSNTEESDIPFDDRGRFLRRRPSTVLKNHAPASKPADDTASNPSPTSNAQPLSKTVPTPEQPAPGPAPGSAQGDKLVELQEMAAKCAQLADELAHRLENHLSNDTFHGISKTACWVHLTSHLASELALLEREFSIHRPARPETNTVPLSPSPDCIAPDTLKSSLDLIKKIVDWHGASLETSDEQICPRQIHQQAFFRSERLLNSVWADPHSKNSADKIQLGLDSVSEIRLLAGIALNAYENLWERIAPLYASAEAAGFGAEELEFISGQKPMDLDALKDLISEIGESLDWCERELTEARQEWEKTKTILEKALAELKAGKLAQAEASQALITQRHWLDLDVEAVCRELDALLNKHLAEINSIARRDKQKAISLASQYAEKYAHSPRIRKGFLKRKSWIESEILIASTSRKSMAGGFSTIALYGAVASIAFLGVVLWFNYNEGQKAVHEDARQRGWIEKIDREQSAARAKAAEQEEREAPAPEKN